MAALRFIGVLALCSVLMLLARWIQPHVIDNIAIYATIGFTTLALVTAVIGMLRS